MRVISTKVHGVLDYTVGALIAAGPWLLKLDKKSAATYIPLALGAGAVVYSLFTNYEWGAVKKLSMSSHLKMDLGSGIVLAASPWLFGFARKTHTPHLVAGLFEIAASLLTKKQPD
jgi:hypothetical protein